MRVEHSELSQHVTHSLCSRLVRKESDIKLNPNQNVMQRKVSWILVHLHS